MIVAVSSGNPEKSGFFPANIFLDFSDFSLDAGGAVDVHMKASLVTVIGDASKAQARSTVMDAKKIESGAAKRVSGYAVCLDAPGRPEVVITTCRSHKRARKLADEFDREMRARCYPDRPDYGFYVREIC